MEVTVLRERPALTGVGLGFVVWFVGTNTVTATLSVALLLFTVGAVLAVYGEGWVRPAGGALAAAGATALLIEGVGEALQRVLGPVLAVGPAALP